ncbi:MAG TPA: (Fe-S)-binding protein [Prosthecobacter sp.]|nr:(Fe-S)-binding protein [Prosthecobacter sp.]
MTIGLFIPCYIDQLYPQVGRATVAILERLGCEIGFPKGQTCCGQPMSNSGYATMGDHLITTFAKLFETYEHVVSPSASCLLHLKEKLEERHDPLAHRIYELTEFLHDIVPEDRLRRLEAHFPHRVGLHQSCHGLRGLGLARPTECMTADFSKPGRLLALVSGLKLVTLDRADECCGFGGTFSVFESDVSLAMGRDRIHDHLSHGAEFITSTDMSCLMHLGGLLSRGGAVTKPIHIAEILANR